MTGIGVGAGLGMLVGHSCIYAPGTTSAQFDGVNQYIDFQNNPASSFAISDPFTFAGWFKTSSAAQQVIIGKMDTVQTHGIQLSVAVGTIYFLLMDHVGDGDGSWLSVQTTPATFADGAWHCVAGSYDGSQTVVGMRVFIDGTEPAHSDVTNAGPISLGTGADLTVGATMNGVTSQFVGNICHTAVWDIEVPEAKLLTLTGASKPLNLLGSYTCCDFSAGLVHWSTDGDGCAIGAGNCLDISGEADHGTYTNSDGTDFVLDYP